MACSNAIRCVPLVNLEGLVGSSPRCRSDLEGGGSMIMTETLVSRFLHVSRGVEGVGFWGCDDTGRGGELASEFGSPAATCFALSTRASRARGKEGRRQVRQK